MRIKKTSNTRALAGKVVNTRSNSTEDAYSCDYENDINTYSTNEVNTGKTWIDGKPIYRKVISITTTATQTGTPINANNIREIISFSGKTNTGLPINFYYQLANTYMSTFIDGTTIYNICSESYAGATAKIIVEYTKTTD